MEPLMLLLYHFFDTMYLLQKHFATLLRLFINNNGDDNGDDDGDDPDDNDGYDQDNESIAQVI